MIAKSPVKKPRFAALLAAILVLLSTSCATSLPDRQELAARQQALSRLVQESMPAFGDRTEIPSPESLHRLSPDQLAEFKAYLDAPTRNHIPRHQRVFDYLKQITDQFAYFENTLSASEALASKTGNCMSLAVLTTALAQAAGIDIGYRLMEDLPVFEYQGSTVIKGVHLSTILYQADWTPPANDVLFVRRPGLQVDYFPSNRTTMVANSDARDYMAMYYQNIAVELVAQNNLPEAFWYAVEALSYNPFHAPAINTLAVINRRHGQVAEAEAIYRFGIENVRDNLSLMRNYHALLVSTGKTDAARELAARLERVDDSSPFHWLALAHEAELDNDFAAAIRYYDRVIEQAPYMHEVHLSLALANYRLGDLTAAERALEKAIGAVSETETKSLYQRKLGVLNREISSKAG